jgi:hypothetical protein
VARHDAHGLGDRLGRDRAARVEAAPDAREDAPLEQRLDPPVRGFGDQQPGRVRPDVDAGAAH